MKEEREKNTGKEAYETGKEQGKRNNSAPEKEKGSESTLKNDDKRESKPAESSEKSGDAQLSRGSGEGGESPGTPGEVATKKIGRRELLLLGCSLLLVFIVSSGGLLVWLKSGPPGSEKSDGLHTSQGPEFKLKPFFIPLSLDDAEPERFVKLILVLELCSEEAERAISKEITEVRSSIFKILMKASPDEVQWERKVLTGEIISAVNLFFENQFVRTVIFQDLAMI